MKLKSEKRVGLVYGMAGLGSLLSWMDPGEAEVGGEWLELGHFCLEDLAGVATCWCWLLEAFTVLNFCVQSIIVYLGACYALPNLPPSL